MKYRKPYILCFYLLIYCVSFSQSVDFNYSTSNNLYCHPQKVVFTQNCSPAPISFIWNFGNGSVGSAGTETITYTNPGSYTVTLTAVYTNSAISVSKTVDIHTTPTISINANRNNLCQPGNVTFTAPGSAFITSYEWDFGDGSPLQTTVGNSIVHNFNSYGNYTITVRGVTAFGCSANASMSIKVMRFPIINTSVTPPNGCIPVNAILRATASLPPDDAVANYVWTFGDGTPNGTTVVNNISHIYNIVTPITTASVSITSVQGCTNQYTFPTFAYGTPPFNTVAVTSDGRSQYCGSERINFTGTATNATQYEWDFGDGTILLTSSTSISHKYQTLGAKTITMTPIFHGCRGTPATINIDIIGVIADYTFSNTCANKNTFQFTNTSLGNVSSFRWTFSDMPGSPDAVNYNVTHSFPATGSFTTKFYLYDAITGCSDSLTTKQYTATPSLVSNKTNVCKDSLIQYSVENTYPPGSGYTYIFHVAGNVINTNTDSSLSYYPTMHGSFNDFVVIDGTGNNTCNDTLYLAPPTNVRGPVLDFSVPPNACFLNNSFPVTNNTAPYFPPDNINNWQWSFGDNTTSNLQDPPDHQYAGSGRFKIILQATDINGCSQKDSVTVTVYRMPKITVLPSVDTLCGGQSQNLFAFTADTLLWLTNYNIDCITCDTVLVNPAVTTHYIAQATNKFGCVSRDTSLVKVFPPFTLQALPADTSVCPLEPVHFQTNVGGFTTWSPATYLDNDTIPNPISVPDSSITYTIVVSDSAGCYADTATARINVYPLPLVDAGPNLIVPYNSGFSLNPAYSLNTVSYVWSPPANSLSCTTCPFPNGVAAETADYTITITSSDGCVAKDWITVIVACEKSNLNLPSAFTPNNDGLNDIFYPMTRGFKVINKFVIFDRWGGKVFERYNFPPNSPAMGWDGKLRNGQITGSMTYVWIIEATCDQGGVIQTKGTITAIR
ncbi:MAG: PKD domain-containing protein [Chitinophagaceae bacterium]